MKFKEQSINPPDAYWGEDKKLDFYCDICEKFFSYKTKECICGKYFCDFCNINDICLECIEE